MGVPGRVTTTPYHRFPRVTRANGTFDYPEEALKKAPDGKFYAKSDMERTAPLDVTYWRARCRLRDGDGRVRTIESSGKSAGAAERALQRRLAERPAHQATGAITANTRIDALWDAYRDQLVDEEKAARTLDSYDRAASLISVGLGGLRLREATTQRLDNFLGAVEKNNGPSVAKLCRSVLSGMFRLAVRYGAVSTNPAREVRTIRRKKSAPNALTAADVQAIVHAVHHSEEPMPPRPTATRQVSRVTISQYAIESDLRDLVTFLASTGARIGEALAVRWDDDLDLDAGTVTISGHIVTAKGQPITRVEGAKSASGVRTQILPPFTVALLKARRDNLAEITPYVFPSSTGRLRDPNSLRKSWRRLSTAIGYEGIGTHSFRKALATQLDEAGISARVAADILGHSQVSMTQDVYMGRNRVHDVAVSVIEEMLIGVDNS
ncbi:tyrosine recombinase XerC [Prescottella equi]|uniref:site-specific integrase n=1 Tax=Rhodococcus hoagii TaxID=43767 RepID=UPI001C85A2A4|nr:site-specific integrase [Prescottella equi]